MGQLKAMLPFRGQRLIEHQVTSLNEAGVSWTVVVLGHETDKLEPLLRNLSAVTWVHNPDYRQGKTTSVKVGVRELLEQDRVSSCRGILLLNVDQPRNSTTIRRVMDQHLDQETASDNPCLFTIPTCNGKGGHPIIMDLSLLPEVLEISEDTQGLKALVRKYEDRTQRVDVGTEEILFDLNTAEDYKRAVEYFGETPV